MPIFLTFLTCDYRENDPDPRDDALDPEVREEVDVPTRANALAVAVVKNIAEATETVIETEIAIPDDLDLL